MGTELKDDINKRDNSNGPHPRMIIRVGPWDDPELVVSFGSEGLLFKEGTSASRTDRRGNLLSVSFQLESAKDLRRITFLLSQSSRWVVSHVLFIYRCVVFPLSRNSGCSGDRGSDG